MSSSNYSNLVDNAKEPRNYVVFTCTKNITLYNSRCGYESSLSYGLRIQK